MTARKLWIIGGACLLLGFTVSCAKQGISETTEAPTNDSMPVVAVAKATTGDLSRNIALTAEFRPYQEVDVMAKVSGYVKKIYVDIGDRVKEGQLLAVLEIPEMENDLTKAGASVERSDAEIARAKDDVRRAESAYQVVHLAYQRLAGVSKARPGLVAQQEIDDAQGKDLVADAQISAARSNLTAVQQAAQESRAALARVKTLYQYARVTAPFTGVVTMRYANTGSMIQAGTASQTQVMPLVRLSQNNLLRLTLPVPESAVPGIHLGQMVNVRVPSLKRSFMGRVARFSNKVTTATRTMETQVDVSNSSFILIPGMYASVDLQLDHRPGVLSIPISAIDLTSNKPAVYKVNTDNTISIAPVKLGLETSDRVEIIDGFKEGEMIVVGPRSGMKPGDRVIPKVVEAIKMRASS